MDLHLQKSKSVRLKEIGKDEAWLQEEVQKDPSILGIGDLSVIERERRQITGGKIDFLMYDPETLIRYEVELMLGKVDESHIIRTIEYWDIERKRFPSLEHRAVIVAEEITNRFFNIITLLNQSIPLIAIQLNATTFEDKLFLNFVKVLDVNEPPDEETQLATEVADRNYWEQKANPKSLAAFDSIIKYIRPTIPDARITYNKTHIALGATGNNFAWFHTRKSGHLHFNVKITTDEIHDWKTKLEEAGIEASLLSSGVLISINVNTNTVSDSKDLIIPLFQSAADLAK